jgi:hypothetical protein
MIYKTAMHIMIYMPVASVRQIERDYITPGSTKKKTIPGISDGCYRRFERECLSTRIMEGYRLFRRTPA